MTNNKELRSYLDKAKLLLLPLIVRKPDELRKWTGPGFIGVYYKDTNKPQWEDKIIVVYDGHDMNIRPILNWNLSEYKYELYEETHNKRVYCIYSYIVPPQFKADFKKIINGDYSTISRQTANHILDVHFKANNGKLLTNYEKVKKILYPPITETLNAKKEYTDAFGGKQILNINQVPLS